ncbi:hypothetical protein [Ilumatobacter sp.]|uniref:hypothetical protein n=1 Tax=Ilumatobacter sp. TaxID=1967498 RepID=UPI003AF4C1FC
MNTNRIRSKWAAVGAAIAVSLGAGGIGIGHATTSTGEKPIYLPIEPCRLADTRPAFQVGPRSTPLGAAETYDLSGWGAVGNCTLPADTAGLALNVTAVDPTAPTFLTLFPDGTTLPLASHLNPTPGQPPTPNAVNVDLSDAGKFSIYNLAGNVHIAIDVVGIYDDHNHDDRYYQKSETYTKTEADALLEARVADPTVVRNTVNIPAGGETGFNFFAICPPGLRATGGGVGAANGGSPNDRVLFSGPTDSTGNFTNTVTGDIPVRWAGRYLNGAASPVDVYVWVICG